MYIVDAAVNPPPDCPNIPIRLGSMPAVSRCGRLPSRSSTMRVSATRTSVSFRRNSGIVPSWNASPASASSGALPTM
jgi:hypothetical protein